MKHRLKNLYLKFQHSGLNGNPAISDAELHELKNAFAEISELFKVYNPLVCSFNIEHEAVCRMLENRNV